MNGKQVISYWWTQETTGNSGTFGEHIHSPLWKDVSHPSPTSENNLISIVAIHIIQKRLIEEVKEVKYCSISTDKVTNV